MNQEIKWGNNREEVMNIAKENNRSILLDFFKDG
jgi:hypothetical protein